jgi:S-DNA-T family DNA segregation ATPase FtsK/SpoIIIE
VVLRSALPAPSGPGRVVLGVGGDELDPVEVDLAAAAPGLLVGGPAGSGRSSALLAVAHDLAGSGLPVVAVAPRRSPLRALPGCVTASDGAVELERQLGDGRCVLLVDDAELLVDSGLAHVLERAVREARDAGTLVVAAGTTEELVTGYRGFVVELRKSRTGVLLSPQSAADGDLLGVRLSRSTGGPVRPGRGLLVRRGAVEPLQLAQAAGAAGPVPSEAASRRNPSSSPTDGT